MNSPNGKKIETAQPKEAGLKNGTQTAILEMNRILPGILPCILPCILPGILPGILEEPLLTKGW